VAETTSEAQEAAEFTQYWLDQLDAYNQEYQRWEKRCERIVKRYRDERQEKSDGSPDYAFKFNALWSNVQTLSPAVYKKAPQPIVERRYLDKDPVARYASMILERALEVTIQECHFHPSTQRSVLDYLLTARGVLWNRYEPTYGEPEDLGETAEDDESTDEPVEEREGGDGKPTEAARPVTWEKVYQDFVSYRNFRHSPAPIWEEVWWVAKREFMTHRELRTRFSKATDPTTGEKLADIVPLKDQTFKDWSDGGKEKPRKATKTAEVWEIWDKTNQEVVFICPDYPQAVLERTPDPLHLQGFWPCGKPLYATSTNDTLVPVPDYIEYQDQAEELDNLAARIKALTDAVRVNGVYDASIPELKRILQEGADNRLIGVAKWGELSAKGGLEGAIDFIPLKDIVEALVKLQESFEVTKRRMDEITGISDIVRGQSSGATKTATEQRIKGQFATLRLEDRQAEVARFCRDNLAIAAEIISEQFSPEILAEMTGVLEFIKEEVNNKTPPVQPPAPQPGMQPMPPDPMMMQQLEQQREMQIEQTAAAIFKQAVELLRNDKMRTFRIDIETDSTVAIDRQAEKEAVVELFTALGGFLEKAALIGQQEPLFVPALGQSLMFFFRRFGAGRDVEGAWEQAIDKVTLKVKQMEGKPSPPSEEEIKAQTEQKKQEMESQRQQQQAQIDQRKAEFEMQVKEREAQIKEREMVMNLEFQERELAMKEREMQMDAAFKAQSAQQDMALKERQTEIEAGAMERKAEIEADSLEKQSVMAEAEHERSMEAGDRKHELAMEAAEVKARQAKQTPKTK